MKNILILPAMMLALASCSKYQVNVLSSNNMQKDPKTGKFVTENDSVELTYSFFGKNAPINLDVYNKLNEPMYVDLQRSAFITDNKAVSYSDDRLHITGDISTSTVGNKNFSHSSGTIDASAVLPKTTVFIPPHTHVNSTLLNVTDHYIEYYQEDKFVKKQIPSLAVSGTSSIKENDFTADQSPLTFKSYVSLYTLHGNVPVYTAFQHDFYVSKLINTGDEPENFDFYPVQRGDYFYTAKTTGFAKVATGVGVAALVTGAVVIESKNQNKGTK